MDTAQRTNRFIFTEGTFVETMPGIGQQFLTERAENRGLAIFHAIQTDHDL